MIFKQIILIFLSILLSANNAFAFPNCQGKYDSDKRSLSSLKGNCSVCHLNNPSGGGPRTEFGNAFAQAGFKITDELVAKFPNLFQKSQESTPAPSPSNTSSTEGQPPSLPAPVIKRIKPNAIKANKQTMVSIMGQNFVNGTKAFIDGSEVMTSFKSNVLLIINFILNTVGIHDLKVKNPDGQESNTAMIKAK